MRIVRGRMLMGGSLVGLAVLVMTGCSSKTNTATTGGSAAPTSNAATTPATTAPTPAASVSSPAAPPVTIAAANVPGVGTVLVNGEGRTLYVLSSEAGGKVTCTDANGCTAVWPDNELPAGVTAATAGSGIQASLLSTVKTADGSLYVTYAGYPLYTFTGDHTTGTAAGQGSNSFGGTWTTMTPAGTRETGAAAARTTPPASPRATSPAPAATVASPMATTPAPAATTPASTGGGYGY